MMTTGDPARSSAHSAPATAAPASKDTASPPADAAGGDSTDAAVRDHIVAEHNALRDVLARVETTTDLHDLLALPSAPGAPADRPLRHRGGRRGVRAAAGPTRAAPAGGLDAVLGEHCEILADLDRLATERPRLPRRTGGFQVHRRATALAARLHAHEEKETALLVGVDVRRPRQRELTGARRPEEP